MSDKPKFYLKGKELKAEILGYDVSSFHKKRLWHEEINRKILYNGISKPTTQTIVYNIHLDFDSYCRIEILKNSELHNKILNLKPSSKSPFTYKFLSEEK